MTPYLSLQSIIILNLGSKGTLTINLWVVKFELKYTHTCTTWATCNCWCTVFSQFAPEWSTEHQVKILHPLTLPPYPVRLRLRPAPERPMHLALGPPLILCRADADAHLRPLQSPNASFCRYSYWFNTLPDGHEVPGERAKGERRQNTNPIRTTRESCPHSCEAERQVLNIACQWKTSNYCTNDCLLKLTTNIFLHFIVAGKLMVLRLKV